MIKINQMNLKDMHRTLQPKAKQYTFFSVFHGNFSKIDHIIMTYRKSQQILQNQNNIMYYFRQQLNKYTIETQTHVD